jgi:AsmA family
MKFLFRWAFRLFILLIILVISGVLLLDTIVKEVTEYRIRRETGLDVKIGKMQVGIFNSKVTIENLIIYNSAEFGGSPLVDMPELHVEYDRDALFSRKLHCKLVRFNLARLNLVEDKNGNLNVAQLQKRLQQTSGNTQPASTNKTSKGDFQFTGIDTLNLTLGKATVLKMKQPKDVLEIKMDIQNQVLTNVQTVQDLGGVGLLIAFKNGQIMDKALQNWLTQFGWPTK